MQSALPALARAGYVLADGVLPWGRAGHPVLAMTSAGGSPLVVKLYTNGRGRATFEHLQGLWASSFRARQGVPGLPRALVYIDEIGALIMERLDGRPLSELGPVDGQSVESVMELLAVLHASDARPLDRHTAGCIIRSLREKEILVRQVAPGIVERFCSLVDALESSSPPRAELVPSHGDFCARNVFVCAGPSEGSVRMVLIDWDHFRWADPAYDVASFGASSWARAVRARRAPNWSVLEKATDVYRRLLPAAAVEDGIRFHAAARLARMSHILVKRPRRAWQAPLLLDEALRLLR